MIAAQWRIEAVARTAGWQNSGMAQSDITVMAQQKRVSPSVSPWLSWLRLFSFLLEYSSEYRTVFTSPLRGLVKTIFILTQV